jgi:histidinol phosphatase-like PHP family hydrolase
MYDFHTHSIFSDGELIPSELVRRAVFNGYEAIAITDHVDFTNVEYVLEGLKKLELRDEKNGDIQVIIGVEISHVPPEKIGKLVRKADDLGAELVVVHGETIVEPVERGTNKAAVSNPSVDILAHPGLISEEEAEIAKENDVYLELTSRRGHCLTNGYVAKVSREVGAQLVLNTDLHSPDDFLTEKHAARILAGAGLGPGEVTKVMAENPPELLKKLGR